MVRIRENKQQTLNSWFAAPLFVCAGFSLGIADMYVNMLTRVIGKETAA